MSDGEPIVFPILFRFHKSVVPSPCDFVDIWRVRHISGNLFEMPETRGGDARLHWIIDGYGRFREARVVGASLTWLRWLSWLWRFTKTRYELLPGRTVTVEELRRLVSGSSRDPEKSSARTLVHYLSKLPADAAFTQEHFLGYMREPAGKLHDTFP